MTKLSIVVPCYKVDKYLSRCLNSLLAQTLDQIEIVCVNDGSPDRCSEILEDYAKRRPDLFTVINKENEGVLKARQVGIDAAKGEYIGFVDPDDYVSPDFAKSLYEAAKEHNADIACCGFRRTDGKRVYSTEMTAFPYDEINIADEPGLLLEVNSALWNKIFRADLLKNPKKLSVTPKAFTDMLSHQLILMNAQKIVFVNKTLISYTIRDESIITSITQGMVHDIYESMRQVRKLYEKRTPQLLCYLDASAFLHLGVSLMYRLSFNNNPMPGAIRRNREFLNRYFPGWRHSPYINLKFVLTHRGANLKLYIVSLFYKLGLLNAFLFIYKFLADTFKRDIKW
jgi:glycosyltransferase involved in cell wall biosynthesis